MGFKIYTLSLLVIFAGDQDTPPTMTLGDMLMLTRYSVILWRHIDLDQPPGTPNITTFIALSQTFSITIITSKTTILAAQKHTIDSRDIQRSEISWCTRAEVLDD